MALTDVDGLAAELRRATDAEVRFDAGDRHLYSVDASHYRHVPLGVVVPRSTEDVVETVRLCREFGAPVTHRGGGTSLAGQAANVAVIIDWSKHLREVLEINPDERWARVQPGCVLDDLRDAAEEHGLTFGPDPSTHNRCTVGGMVGNNACGVHSVMAGRTVENVEALKVLRYDGTVMRTGPGQADPAVLRRLEALRDRYGSLIRDRYPAIPRRVSGYNLDELLPERGMHVARSLVGTEGTCVTVLEATVRLVPSPRARSLVVLGFPSVFDAADAVPDVMRAEPIGLEGMDRFLIDNMITKQLHLEALELLPDGDGWLLVEFGGATAGEAADQARRLVKELDGPSSAVYSDPDDAAAVWQVREAGLGATAFVPGRPDAWSGWEDAAVPPDRLGDYLRDFQALMDDHGLEASLYGHFGDGCIHCRISFDHTTAGGAVTYRRFVEQAADLVVSYGGSLSGEHGDGQSRAELLGRMFGDELVGAFEEFKGIWDPDDGMNPGRVVRPRRLDADLRMGPDYRPEDPETKFAYPNDGFSFAAAQKRCVGVGLCRRDDGHGTMCPSYMVTHEEQHSTRGRARLLFEMLQPDADLDGWRSEAVKDALDLCLSCKGCKVDCPVNVDMATYKAEFMAHHYAGRRRPAEHYALGLIPWASRAASRLPGLTNAVLGSRAVKRLAGIAVQRATPRYAPQTLTSWYRRRGGPAIPDGRPVILFPDTFTNSFAPHVGQAAVTVLEQAGYRVELPDRWLCCGRPLYDFGMLDLARHQLHQLVGAFRDPVSAGVKIVGLEPSCVATFRDELGEMLPNDHDARRLAQATFTLAELLADHTPEWEPPRLERGAVVHGHCHQKAVMGMTADRRVIEALGLDAEFLDAGCCGLAGSFGYEAGEKYAVSVAAGERRLAPAVRAADDDALVVVDGFSCRSQIDQLVPGRRTWHLAEELALAAGGEMEPERGARLTWRDAAALGALLGGGIWAARRVVT
jgi:FAD/FMN-containing dehydrogenase/Fe-S oxidoreductase